MIKQFVTLFLIRLLTQFIPCIVHFQFNRCKWEEEKIASNNSHLQFNMGVLGYLLLYNKMIHQMQFKRGKLSSRFSICDIINFI